MVDIDLKDRKILYQLDLNCRQSNAQIGKRVGLSKQVVDYRIKRMEEEVIIRNYYTVIDSYKLGYYFYRFYIKFQYVSTEITRRIIHHLVNYQKISTVATGRGFFDLIAVFWVKDLNEFYAFWEKTLAEFGDYFAEQKFTIYIRGIGFPISIKLDDNYVKRHELETFGVGEVTKIDEVDYQILQLIALNARIPIIEIANKLGCSSQNVIYRLKNLMNKKVIQAFRVDIDLKKLFLIRFKVDIHLKEHGKKSDIVKFVKKLPNLRYYSSSIGLCDLEFELIAENTEKLVEIMEKIEQSFPGVLRNYEYHTSVETHIETFMPKLTKEDLR